MTNPWNLTPGQQAAMAAFVEAGCEKRGRCAGAEHENGLGADRQSKAPDRRTDEAAGRTGVRPLHEGEMRAAVLQTLAMLIALPLLLSYALARTSAALLLAWGISVMEIWKPK